MSVERFGRQELSPQPENAEKNLNDEVWIKVTEEGEQIRNDYYEELGTEASPLKKDAEGWTGMQLHQVASLFGQEFRARGVGLPIETVFRTIPPGKEQAEVTRNLNHEIWVNVTPEGEQSRNDYYEWLGTEASPLKKDAEGWTKMQWHQALSLFDRERPNFLPIETVFRTEAP